MTVDQDVLTVLRATTAHVWDGHVDADETEKVISVPLPFVLYYGKRTNPVHARAGGRAERGNDLGMSCAGATREQADALADKIEAALDGRPFGKRTAVFTDRDGPSRDLRYTRPGGDPLFYTAIRFNI